MTVPPHGTGGFSVVPPHGTIRSLLAPSPVPPHGHLLYLCHIGEVSRGRVLASESVCFGSEERAARFKSKTGRLRSAAFLGVLWRSLVAAGGACPDRLALLSVTCFALFQRYGSVTP